MSENVFDDRGLQLYLGQIAAIEPMTREEEQRYARLAKNGDIEARQKIITANLKFVVKIASRYQNRGLSLTELISEGNQGLIKAIDKFEPERHNKFISYAVWWIKQKIISALTEKNNLIRMPLDKANLISKIKSEKEKIYKSSGNKAKIEDVSAVSNIPKRHIKKAQLQEINVLSLDDKSYNSHHDLVKFDEFLSDPDITDPRDLYLAEKREDKIEKVLGELPARDTFIIKEYFGLEGKKGKNFAQIAEELGLSRERVRQIQKKALEKIAETLEYDFEEFFIMNDGYDET